MNRVKIIMSHLFKNYYFRYAFCISLAVFVAMFLDKYDSYSHQYWITLATFLVGIGTRGAPLRLGIYFMILLAAAVALPSILFNMMPALPLRFTVTTVLMIVIGWKIYINKTEHFESFITYVMFAMFWLIVITTPQIVMDTWRDEVMDIFIGGVVGMFFAIYIFPVKFFEEFSEGLIPLLNTLMHAMNNLANQLNKKNESETAIEQVLKDIVSHTRQYPEWVYVVGFNPGLRAGFRYFLVHLDYLIEVAFSLQEFMKRLANAEMPETLKNAFISVIQQNNEIMQIVIDRFESHGVRETQADYISDVDEMNEQLKLIMPAQLELMEFEPEKIALSGMARDLKDFRDIAMKLVMALPAAASLSQNP